MKAIKATKHVTLLLLTGILALPLGTAVAQTAPPSTAQGSSQAQQGQRRGDRDRWLENLGLTDDQKAQVKSIRDKGRDQVQAVRNDSSLTQEQKEAKIKDIRKNTHNQVWGLLTPEQQQKAQQMRKQHHRHGNQS